MTTMTSTALRNLAEHLRERYEWAHAEVELRPADADYWRGVAQGYQSAARLAQDAVEAYDR